MENTLNQRTLEVTIDTATGHVVKTQSFGFGLCNNDNTSRSTITSTNFHLPPITCSKSFPFSNPGDRGLASQKVSAQSAPATACPMAGWPLVATHWLNKNKWTRRIGLCTGPSSNRKTTRSASCIPSPQVPKIKGGLHCCTF